MLNLIQPIFSFKTRRLRLVAAALCMTFFVTVGALTIVLARNNSSPDSNPITVSVAPTDSSSPSTASDARKDSSSSTGSNQAKPSSTNKSAGSSSSNSSSKSPSPSSSTSNGAKPSSSSSSSPPSTSTPSTPSQAEPGRTEAPTTPPAPISTASQKFGMSAPVNKWSERLAQVGEANIRFRRIFLVGFDDNLSEVSASINAGMTPVISWKVTPYSWAQVAAGSADAALHSLVTRLNAIPGNKILVLHHEPAGDGSAQDFVAMQLHALPILSTANNASVGIIANGWWWSAQNQGYSDAELAQWIPSSLKNVCDFIAADTYQDANLVEDGSVKASRMAAWAKRTGGVGSLGIGEFNGFTAPAIKNVMNVVKAEPLYKWALVWNSGPTGLGTPLEGDRLAAFIAGKATASQN